MEKAESKELTRTIKDLDKTLSSLNENLKTITKLYPQHITAIIALTSKIDDQTMAIQQSKK